MPPSSASSPLSSPKLPTIGNPLKLTSICIHPSHPPPDTRLFYRKLLARPPAGQIDANEEPDAIRATGLRELHEEAGYTLAPGGEMISLGHFFPSAGFTDEHSHLLLARPVIAAEGGARPDESEAITECRAFSPAELRGMIASGEVRDANTLAAFARMVAMGVVNF